MFTLIYLIIGICWGRYAVKRQIELKDSPTYILIGAFFNTLLWPLSIFVAYKRGVLFSDEK